MSNINFQHNIDGKIGYMNIFTNPLSIYCIWPSNGNAKPARNTYFLQSVGKWYIEEYLLSDNP